MDKKRQKEGGPIEKLNAALSGLLLPAALTAGAIFLLFYLKGLPFRGLAARLRAGARRGRGTSLRATAMALAGTLGVGNITGVADAVGNGGAGVLFWMWLSALSAMVIKYAEILLLMRRKKALSPGPAPLSPACYMRPRAVGALFAVCGLCAAFTVGSSLQTTALAQAFSESFGLPAALPCLMTGLLALFCVFRNKKELFALTALFIPLFSLLYLLLCAAVILQNRGELPQVFRAVFRGAFDFRAAAGGLSVSAWTALRYGVIRGLLSNEAGCGTAPIAHAHANADPSFQASFGVIEVAVDTLLLCTATGLAVLLCPFPGASPAAAVSFALSSVFGGAARYLLPAALFCFAFATVLCWSLYLEAFSAVLFRGGAAAAVLKAALCVCCACAFLFREDFLWQAADLAVCLMTLINLYFLCARRRELRGP